MFPGEIGSGTRSVFFFFSFGPSAKKFPANITAGAFDPKSFLSSTHQGTCEALQKDAKLS